MKQIYLILIILFSLNYSLNAQENIQYPNLKKQIDSLKIIDQEVQQNLIKSNIENRKELEKIKNETFIRHINILKTIINTFGFPGFDKVGKTSSFNFWLCVQHCDKDLEFQEKVLKLMKKELKNKNANSENYAYLKDRVNINSGKAQIYGTQVEYQNRTAVPKNLTQPKKVNKKRKSVGLGTLEEYLKSMTEFHREMNPE